MRHSLRCLLAVLPLGCSETVAVVDAAAPVDVTDTALVDVTDGPSDAVRADTPTDLGADVAAPPYGIDSRPRNATCRAFARPSVGTTVQFALPFAALPFTQPVGFYPSPDGDRARFFVIERRGLVVTFPAVGATRVSTVLDLSARVDQAGEGGLLGLAFHPRFSANGQVFLSYTVTGDATAPLLSRVSRFVSRDGGRTVDPASETVLLTVRQPFTNHNGGHIAFGPDGYLYIGFGDGGSGGDPMGNGQNLNTLLGKFLRIDVDRGSPYGIPSDNPFAGGGGRPEIYAYGLRNPWRWSFDRETGDLWAGDVGQNAIEEIDLIRRGGNYGWSTMEGTSCYAAASCARAGLILPVAEYDRTQGASITGGFVYRGAAIPELRGVYVYGDFISGRVWGLFPAAAGGYSPRQIITVPAISSFGQDLDGELYTTSFDGAVRRLAPGPTPAVDTVPPRLSLTGCVSPADVTQPAPGVIPYDVNAALWSDGADKQRFLAIPDGATITVRADGDWDLPIGSVLLKTFSIAGRRVETRLMVRHADGDWAGYSYAWNDAQTDAIALPGSQTRDLGGGRTWTYPNRTQCLECHTTASGRTLGLETAQFNREIVYAPGRSANQLTTLDHLGMFSAPLPAAASLPAMPRYDAAGASVTDRARAYVHANCAHCHRPGSTGRGDLDLRFGTPARALGVCDVAPQTGSLGIADARVFAPGSPARSVLSARMRSTDTNRMPPLATRLVDPTGAALLDAWISATPRCP